MRLYVCVYQLISSGMVCSWYRQEEIYIISVNDQTAILNNLATTHSSVAFAISLGLELRPADNSVHMQAPATYSARVS